MHQVNVSVISNQLYRAVSLILEASQELRKCTPEAQGSFPITEAELEDRSDSHEQGIDLVKFLSTSELSELTGLEECRRALISSWRSIEQAKQRIMQQAMERRAGR